MKAKMTSFNKIICVILALIMIIPTAAPRVKAYSNFSVGQDAVDLIKSTEGFQSTKYWDYSQWSIGYGTRCGADEYPNGISEAEAERLLRNYANEFGRYVNNFANRYDITLTQNQFDALVCLTYALGDLWTAYDEFDLKTILINGSENYSFIRIARAFAEWRVAGGEVLQGLVNRRQKEIQLFLKNRTSPNQQVYRVDSEGGMNLRSGPSTDYSVTGRMVYNYIFCITEAVTGSDGSIWGKTNYEGKDQWISLAYCVEYVGGPVPLDGKARPVATAAPSVTQASSSTQVSETWKITSPDGVNLRTGPGTNYERVAILDTNQQITVTEKVKNGGYEWGKTTVNGKTGWCALDYAVLISSQTIPGATLKSIYLKTKPSKTEYIEGEKLDTTGMNVMAVYTDGTEKEVKDYEISGFESKEGSYNVTVTYMKKTAMFRVNVKPRMLLGIEVDTPPEKTTYKTGEGLSLKGLKVNGIYEGNVTMPIEDFYLEDVDGFSSTPGTKTITITKDDFKTEFSVQVTEKTATGIKITNLPLKTEYVVGQKLNTEGMIVHAIYENGRKNVIEDYTVTGYDPKKLGEQTIVVSYNDYKDTFVVNVSEADETELYGDLDGNGTRDIFDLMLLNKYINGTTEFDESREYLTDVNLDGYTDIRDVEALSLIVSEQ